jgi:dTDP-glucose 4,6-dehydratase
VLDALKPRASGNAYEQLIEFVQDRPGHDLRYAMNIEKLSTELGWQPQHSLEDGLAQTVAWYLDNQDWCAQITQDDTSIAQGQRQGLRA